MKLLIVVDASTGFDAPSATYLYIDKSMQDHGLFQAICRVNRIHDDTKNMVTSLITKICSIPSKGHSMIILGMHLWLR